MSIREPESLPQSGPALLITAVSDEPGSSSCIARIPGDSPFRDRDREGETVPALLAIEMAAQAAAAMEPAPAERIGSSAGESQRLLVGVRAVDLHVSRLDAADSFRCKATALTNAGPLRIYRFEVSTSAGELVATGELSTYFDSDS